MTSHVRIAVRLQRFEVWSSVLLVGVVATTTLMVRERLVGVGAPVECLTPWLYPDVVYDALRCDPLREAFSRINWDEAGLVMTAMSAVPLVVGLLLGVGLVGREIEGGTAPTVWALAGSRRRWLLGRLLPILLILVALLAVAAITSDVLAAARVPWQLGRPSFDDAGSHGPGVVARGLAAFGVSLAVGAWSGRMLPAILVSAFVALFLGAGGYFLLEAWVEANAHEIAVPFAFNGDYDGGRFIYSFHGLPDDSGAEQLDSIAFGVHSPDYPRWVATEVAAFGAVGLALLGATFAIVERRRPF